MAKKNSTNRPVRSRHKVVEFDFGVPERNIERDTKDVRARLGIVRPSKCYEHPPGEGNTSKYKGVDLRRGRWRARVSYMAHLYVLGTFDKEKDAARAYDKAAIELWGDDALTNQEYYGDLDT